MTPTEKNHLIRWLLLTPGVLWAAMFGFLCSTSINLLFTEILPIFSDYSMYLAISLPMVTAVAWVSASYYIPPSHRITMVWASFIIGSILVIVYIIDTKIWLSAVVSGLLASCYYTKKHQTKRKTQ